MQSHLHWVLDLQYEENDALRWIFNESMHCSNHQLHFMWLRTKETKVVKTVESVGFPHAGAFAQALKKKEQLVNFL